MASAWYDENKTEEDRIYEESIKKIKSAIEQGLSFKQAAGLVEVKDDALRTQILEDSLKVLIAEMHFNGKKPLKEMAQAIKVPVAELERISKEMLLEVEDAAIEAYKQKSGQVGNA